MSSTSERKSVQASQSEICHVGSVSLFYHGIYQLIASIRWMTGFAGSCLSDQDCDLSSLIGALSVLQYPSIFCPIFVTPKRHFPSVSSCFRFCRYKHVLLIEVDDTVILGDPLGAVRVRNGLYLTASELPWKTTE